LQQGPHLHLEANPVRTMKRVLEEKVKNPKCS
jgi:hypothetical protein